jgi:outer membrane protein
MIASTALGILVQRPTAGAGVFSTFKGLIVKRSVIVLVSAIVSTGFASLAGAAEAKIGVVSIQRLAQEAPQSRAANETIRAEFAPKQKEIETQAVALKAREEKLTKDAATMTEVQRSAAEKELRDGYRDLQLKQSAFQDDLNARRTQEQEKLNGALLDEVQKFAKAQGYDLILADGVLYATTAYDVTGPILQGLKGGAPAAAKPATTPAPTPAR